MAVYGLTLLSFCYFVGVFLGDLLGKVLGVNSNVGGVGIAMLLLILLSEYLLKEDKLSQKAQDGIGFWSSMYIPVVVAMTAQQNVVAALSGGISAILAGVIAVLVAFILIKPITAIGAGKGKDKKVEV